MNLAKVARRFLLPGFVVSILYGLKYKCVVSPKAEVDYTGNVKIGPRTQISSFSKIKATEGPLTIGANVSVAAGVAISTYIEGIVIGDDCLIGPNVVILGGNHRYDRVDVPTREQGRMSKGVRIGNNVWIGANSVIMDGAKIGDGAIVTPNAVVSGALPANSIVQGNPAKVIFERR